MLTVYNGTNISYDEIGNPNNWHNALSMSWDKRELTSLALNNNGTLSFSYNSSGLRTQKTYTNGNSVITHNYLLDGSIILKETILNSSVSGATTDTLHYFYDETGVAGFEYNGAKYHYIKNLQGDIVSIYNNNGAVVVNYTYDAWGNVLSVTGSMADTIGAINPFRYRGYYYDTETGFYYLQSRYYDPYVGRFINADAYIGTGGVVGFNIFTYCVNNPIAFIDPMGTCPHDGVFYVEGDFVDSPAYNPDCDLCKAHGSYELTDKDGVSCVFYNSSIEWSSPVDHVNYHNSDPDAAYGSLRIRNKVRGIHHGIDFYPGDSGIGLSGYDGTEQNVYAMYYGTVIRISDNFYAGTGAVYILHDDGRMAVYGEINPIGLKKGDRVEAGQLIGVMMRSTQNTLMLHLEMYYGTKRDAEHRIDPTFVYDFEDRWNK